MDCVLSYEFHAALFIRKYTSRSPCTIHKLLKLIYPHLLPKVHFNKVHLFKSDMI